MKIGAIIGVAAAGYLVLEFARAGNTTSAAGTVPVPGLAVSPATPVGVSSIVNAIAPSPAAANPKLGNNDPNFQPWLTQEIQKIFGNVSNTPPQTQKDHDILVDAIVARRLGSYAYGVFTLGYWKNVPGDCGSASNLGALGVTKQVGAAASLAVAGAQVGAKLAGAAVSAIPIAGAIVSTVTAVFSLIFAGHQQAVALEQSTLCSAVLAVNQFLDSIDYQYSIGNLSGPAAIQGLEQVYSQFNNGTTSIQRTSGCNAACVYLRELRGIIDAKSTFDF